MNLQHIVKVNGQVHEVTSANKNMITFGNGKRRTVLHRRTGRIVFKHVLTGQFIYSTLRG
jgi:hypothetical protein